MSEAIPSEANICSLSSNFHAKVCIFHPLIQCKGLGVVVGAFSFLFVCRAIDCGSDIVRREDGETKILMTLWELCDILMTMDCETKGKQKVDVHYVIAGIPYVIEENFEGYYHDHGADMLADFLLSQETTYQSLQGTRGNDVAEASSSNPRSDHDRGQSSDSMDVGNPSAFRNFEEQLAIDEALARELQYVEDNLAAASLSDIPITAAVTEETSPDPANGVATARGISALVSRQDGIDPDNMTYEELQSLGEAIGVESRGLSDTLISNLKTLTYRTGFFSRKDKNEECVICCMSYKNGEMLITLPCKHYYHSHCVKRWLKINKACPVCNKEVFGS